MTLSASSSVKKISFCDDRVVLLKAGHAEDSLVMRVNLSGEIEGGAG
jgi:hypothetical protein